MLFLLYNTGSTFDTLLIRLRPLQDATVVPQFPAGFLRLKQPGI